MPTDSATARAELGDRVDWGHLAANVAYLVDLVSYQVHSDYTVAVTDPEDPDVKSAMEVRKRLGIKPPPVPLVPPVAVRPATVAVEHEAAFQALVERFGDGTAQIAAGSVEEVVGRHWVTDTARIDHIIDML